MTTLTCHSLRAVEGHDDVFFCAHPRVHARFDIVTRAICKSCALRTQPPPQCFRAVGSRPEQSGRRADLQFVVAHYRENLDWLYQFQGIPTVVYEKGDQRADLRLPNIGREAHTYLHHIVANYERLAPVTVFLQGDPLAHVPDLPDKIWQLEPDVGFRDFCDLILVEDGNGEPIQPGLGLKALYEALFGEPSPDFFVCHSAACFAVSRENILCRPRAFYESAMDLVVRRPLGPWEIERLWQYIFRNRVVREGVVTAADAGFFRNLQLFLLSYRRHNRHPLLVMDLGLHEDQRRWCLEQPGVTVQSVPTAYPATTKLRQLHWWQSWLKPFQIYQSAFDRVLWIDADCTVQDDVTAVLESIGEQPFLVRDGTTIATENNPELYRYLTLPPGTRTEGINLNAGVVGLCKIRDRALLNAWAYGVDWAARNPDRQALSAWVDQGILLWATHRTGRTSCIRQDLSWNWPGGSTPQLLQAALGNGCSILEEIGRRYPAAKIVHWLGIYKLSGQLDREVERLFLDGFDGQPGLGTGGS